MKASFESMQLHNGTENVRNVIFRSSDVSCKCHIDAEKSLVARDGAVI